MALGTACVRTCNFGIRDKPDGTDGTKARFPQGGRLDDGIAPRVDAPVTFFALVLPFGISSGFISVSLPFILTREGFSVAAAGAMVALGVSANLWRLLWDRSLI